MTVTVAPKSKHVIAAQAESARPREQKSRTRQRRLALVAILLVAPAIYWAGERRVPAGAAEGATLSGAIVTPRASGSSLRVGSFNIHAGKGLDGQRDIQRTANCLRGMDLVALNEVAGGRPWEDWNQSQQLAEVLDCQWLFAPTESRLWHGAFGNGLVTRCKTLFWQRIPFDLARANTHRNLVLTAIEVSGVRVNVLLTHLDSRDLDRRHNQLRAAGELFLSLAEPAILLGDLNSGPEDEQLQRLLNAPGVVDAVTAGGAGSPAGRIDWILTRGLRTLESGVVDNGASDHPFVWAELEVAK
jgi:endonuclease/exonuclease/phosphatase family metal-dependent hydrolase